MGNGGDVLDHNDFQTRGLQGPDTGLTSLAGTLPVALNGLQSLLPRRLVSALRLAPRVTGSVFTSAT